MLSTLVLSFTLTVWPMMDIVNDALQLLNELTVLISVQMLFLWTQYVPEV